MAQILQAALPEQEEQKRQEGAPSPKPGKVVPMPAGRLDQENSEKETAILSLFLA